VSDEDKEKIAKSMGLSTGGVDTSGMSTPSGYDVHVTGTTSGLAPITPPPAPIVPQLPALPEEPKLIQTLIPPPDANVSSETKKKEK